MNPAPIEDDEPAAETLDSVSWVLAYGPTEDDGLLMVLEGEGEAPPLAAFAPDQLPGLAEFLWVNYPEIREAALKGEKGVAGGKRIQGLPHRSFRALFNHIGTLRTRSQQAKGYRQLVRDLYTHILALEEVVKELGGLARIELPNDPMKS